MTDAKDPIRVEISYKTILFTAAFIAGIWFIFLIKEIIILVLLSVILISALVRPVDWLTSKRVPRTLSAIIVYFIMITNKCNVLNLYKSFGLI